MRNKAYVYLRDKKAGLLERTDAGYRFIYYPEYLASKDAQPVSLTLPLREKPYNSFFKRTTNTLVPMR